VSRSRARTACAAALLNSLFLACVCGAALAQVTFIGRETLAGAAPGASAGATHRLRISLVRLEGSGWTRARARTLLGEAVPILARCGVALGHADLVSLTVPPRYLDFSTPAARELARAWPVRRPAVYLVRDTRKRPAFDAEAIGRGNSRTRPELADTIWITAATRDAGIALAHELAHVLMDSGEHSEERGNLMRDQTSAQNTALSPEQCARLRDTASRNGLIEKATR